MNDGTVIIETKLDTKSFEAQIESLENKLEELEANYKVAIEDAEFPEEEIKSYKKEIEQTKNKLVDLYKRQINLNKATQTYNNSFGKAMGKIGKLSLAIFGIRSAYMLIRQSANQLAQENDVIAGKLNAIKTSLANAIAPIAEVLVNLVYRLLSYLNVITKMFFKVDLFKKSSKSAKSTLGSAKKLQKTLAGFDEVNILNSNKSVGAGAGGGNIKEPEAIDTSKFENFVKNTAEMFEELVNINRTEMAEMLLEQEKTWGLLKLGWFDTIQGIAFIFKGLIDVFGGVFDILKGIANGNEEAIQQGVERLVEAIGELLRGLVQTILGVIEMILGLVWGTIKSIIDWVYEKLIKPIGNFFSELWQGIKNGISNAITWVKDKFNAMVTFFSKIVTKISNLFKKIGTKVGEVVGGAFKAVINGVIGAIEKILNFPIKSINKLIDVINKVPGIDLKTLPTFNLPRLARGGIVNMPGRGVPVGGAIAGERGQEGVLPLTDAQQMELIGQAIGRYVTINLTNITKLNARQINKEMRKVNAESDFATNG